MWLWCLEANKEEILNLCESFKHPLAVLQTCFSVNRAHATGKQLGKRPLSW